MPQRQFRVCTPAADGRRRVGTAQDGSPQATYPNTAAAPPGDVVPSSYASPATGNWRQRLDDAIEALEAETPLSPATPGDVAQHARLRMLYAAAGRREDAARPIPDSSPATQQFLSKELEGLGTWLDAERVPDPARRAVEAKPPLTEALAQARRDRAAAGPKRGVLQRGAQLRPHQTLRQERVLANQELLLYAELENLVSEPTAQGFRTSLRSSYQILDELGRQVVAARFRAGRQNTARAPAAITSSPTACACPANRPGQVHAAIGDPGHDQPEDRSGVDRIHGQRGKGGKRKSEGGKGTRRHTSPPTIGDAKRPR